MKLVSTLVAASAALALVSIAEGGLSNHYTAVDPNLAADNNISSNVIGTGGSNSYQSLSPVADLPTNNASTGATHASLSTTAIVPRKTKTYVAGLRSTAGGKNFCSASLISPTHLLAGTYCVRDNARWASIGSHYSNGTQDGEQIKVVAILNHPNSNTNFTGDLTVLVLEKPSSFKPVPLAASDDSDVYDGERATKMGWDDTGGEDTMAYELTRAEVQLMSNENCLKETNVDDTMLCSRGAANETSCTGDYGGPVIVERPSGDVLVGVVSWGSNCGQPGFPSIYSRISSARGWIDAVVSGVCFHRSG